MSVNTGRPAVSVLGTDIVPLLRTGDVGSSVGGKPLTRRPTSAADPAPVARFSSCGACPHGSLVPTTVWPVVNSAGAQRAQGTNWSALRNPRLLLSGFRQDTACLDREPCWTGLEDDQHPLSGHIGYSGDRVGDLD